MDESVKSGREVGSASQGRGRKPWLSEGDLQVNILRKARRAPSVIAVAQHSDPRPFLPARMYQHPSIWQDDGLACLDHLPQERGLKTVFFERRGVV